MKIEVHSKKLVPKEKLNDFSMEQTRIATEERLERTLKNFEDEIQSLEVHFEDESTHSAKFDGRCKIHLHPVKGQVINVDAKGENFSELLSNAAQKILHVLEHQRDRVRDKKRTSKNSLQ